MNKIKTAKTTAITVLTSFLLMSLMSLEAKTEGQTKMNTKMVQYTGMQIGPYGMRPPHRTVKSKAPKKAEVKTKDSKERKSLRASSGYNGYRLGPWGMRPPFRRHGPAGK